MKKQIEQKVKQLIELTNLNLMADYASVYGGYRLDLVGDGGGRFGCFGRSSTCERMKAKEFSYYLDGLIGGLTFKK